MLLMFQRFVVLAAILRSVTGGALVHYCMNYSSER